MRVAFYEDGAVGGLGPIALARPVFELVCGRFSLRERLVRSFGLAGWGAFLRDDLAEAYRETHPQARVNDTLWLREGPTLLINGRWLPGPESLAELREDEAGWIDDRIAFLTLDPDEAPLLDASATRPLRDSLCPDWHDVLLRIARTRRGVQAAGRLIEHPWDLVNHNAAQLVDDFRLSRDRRPHFEPGPQIAILGPAEDVSVDPQATVDPFVVLDARQGPVSIEAGAVVQSFTRLEGPCHVGRGAHLFRANVRGETTIGPACRVGGEIEASILHAYVNKYHDGFLGHSYVCPWVNLGALTTASDLKSDYSNVQVPLWGEPIDTGSTKAGCYIGDHAKTAIGSLFNTGTSIGVMCLVLPAGELLPRHIPSFSRIWHGELDDGVDLTAALETARMVMARRDQRLTAAQERLFRFLHDQTRREREAALRRRRGDLQDPQETAVTRKPSKSKFQV